MNYENIVGIDYANELIGIGESSTDSSFRVGDIANDCIRLNRLSKNDITNQSVYAAVGSFIGKQSRTIRHYAEIADFYTPAIRREYSVLKFDHFRFAIKYDNWREILEYAVSQDELGRPATVDNLIAKFGKFQAVAIPESEAEIHIEYLKKIVYNIPMPGETRRWLLDALEYIKELKIPSN